ncbi:subtilase-type protease inhibitor [Streptomyces bambusae]|uniref:SSI family serine proteinase inhibitor n=1 Tax=Streptomyces bambusae TaxID=1550616 RepID=UPI001CFE74FA|nr:SSI family serine proteinase inhibitor [Streptomyces bambusae]MCB5168911.1 subtilase-type protease inhibitor [Streptomyces bambusae]
MLSRLALASVAAAAFASGPLPPLPLGLLHEPEPDRLTVTVAETGNPRANGTYELTCEPIGGTHPEARRACARLDTFAKEGSDPFAPVSTRRMCTQQYGGPATARVTGTWLGKPVKAEFDRKNGCEISRWKDLEPVLPSVRS